LSIKVALLLQSNSEEIKGISFVQQQWQQEGSVQAQGQGHLPGIIEQHHLFDYSK
jgi:hypothetical protein